MHLLQTESNLNNDRAPKPLKLHMNASAIQEMNSVHVLLTKWMHYVYLKVLSQHSMKKTDEYQQ
jgi:hypothetical protein